MQVNAERAVFRSSILKSASPEYRKDITRYTPQEGILFDPQKNWRQIKTTTSYISRWLDSSAGII